MTAPLLLMTEPSHYDVHYAINPWMRPDAWSADPARNRDAALSAWRGLAEALRAAGARIETIPGAPGQPDMVFPANAAIVLDGRALLARFRHPERRGEEAPFAAAFNALRDRLLLREVATLPEGCVQEGAGDAIWDRHRRLFWAAHGPRSGPEAPDAIRRFFDAETVPLRLAAARFYHLDTCFCPLDGGEILYYPPALDTASRDKVRARVPADLLLEASEAEANAFCVNAVNWGRTVVMAAPPDSLRARLAARGYEVVGVDLAPFLLSGGGAFCMTLRLDL